MHRMRLSNRVAIRLFVRDKNIENTNNQLKYVVIRSEKGTITTFELFFEVHSADRDIRSLGAANPVISYFLL